MTLPAEDMQICHMGDRYWRMIDSESSEFGRLAQLQSVWWMDVVAVFKGVPPGRYKVQWRLKVTSDAPIINTDFKVVIYDKDEVSVTGVLCTPSLPKVPWRNATLNKRPACGWSGVTGAVG